MLVLRHLLSAAVVVASLHACATSGGDNQGASEEAAEGPTRASSKITADEGGELALGSATLSLPRGALTEDAVVTIESSEAFEPLPGTASLEGLVYDIGPDAAMLHVPVSLQLPSPGHCPSGKRPVISRFDEAVEEWEDLATNVSESGELNAEILSFSLFAVRYVSDAEPLDPIECDAAPCVDEPSLPEAPARASSPGTTTVRGRGEHPEFAPPRRSPKFVDLGAPFVGARASVTRG